MIHIQLCNAAWLAFRLSLSYDIPFPVFYNILKLIVFFVRHHFQQFRKIIYQIWSKRGHSLSLVTTKW